jgi:hypothetical protein
MKYKMSSLLYILWNSKGLARSFSSKLEISWFCKKIITLYTINFCSECTRQFTITSLGAHTLTRRGVCHISKQSTTRRPTSHFLQQKRVLQVFLLSEHTRRLHFPLDGQRCECFSSSRLSWAPGGTWPASRNATDRDIRLVQLYNQISHLDSTEFFYVSFFHHMTCAINRHWE